jgi:tRNA(Ile)-lysidine synthase
MLSVGDRLGVAVSGGADSVALLHILHLLASQFGVELVVLHMNHHLRGVQSEADESFVRSLAVSMSIPVVGGESYLVESNLEAEARRLRREFFAACRQSHNLNRIALGHTLSDQAETVLHRFLRGTGLRGLAGMRFVTPDGLIRPLLTTSRREVREWAAQVGISWREDSSNSDLRFTRNRLRQETIPLLAVEYNENLEAVLAGTSMLAQAEEDYWTDEVERVYGLFAERTRLGSIFQIGDLVSLPLALRRRVIRRALDEVRAKGLTGLDFSHVECILALCESTQGHDRVLVPGADALRSFDSLLLSPAGRLTEEPRGYAIPLKIGQQHELPFDAGQIRINWINQETLFCDKFKEDQEFSIQRVRLSGAALMGRPLLVRNWEPGDELHRPGHSSPEKIKRLFQESRVRLWQRRHWPVVLCGDKIVWVRGFGAAETFTLSNDGPDGVELSYRAESRAGKRA